MATEVNQQVGYGTVEIFGPDGVLKSSTEFKNLITDAGDDYHARKIIASIAPAAATAPTAATGMKLGTGVTAASKNGAGALLGAYIAASNLAFDATFPSISNLGAGLGVNAVYKSTYGAGVATNAAITEAILCNDSATNLTSTAANSYQRVVFAAQNKGAPDTLVITWNVKQLGV